MPDLPHSPAADRNKGPILAQLQAVLGASGTALEVASGTGQHVVCFATALPGWTWQPTDSDIGMLPVIAERVGQSGLVNILPPRHLDVLAPRWPVAPHFDAIYCANMLHIAPWSACMALMDGAARHLRQGGLLITYGPYFERGVPPASGNRAFDEHLRARDPAWGVRALDDVAAEARRAGLVLTHRYAMPADNLLLVFEVARSPLAV